MTRDTYRVADNHDGQAEVFSALWTAAPSFPQLPPDAPEVLRKLTINVQEPRKVYTIYCASRRHGFQILVERYIIQLQHGCQDSRCITSTCFMCRRKVAGKTPLRRYNATSARTLACFLASQENPEKGLCEYAWNKSSKSPSHGRLREASKSVSHLEWAKDAPWGLRSSKSPDQNSGNGQDLHNAPLLGADGRISGGRPIISKLNKSDSGSLSETDGLEHILSVVRVLQEPVKKDHRSFVQNLFGTVAFRMLEWLTPRNLEAMITSDAQGQSPPMGQCEVKNKSSDTAYSEPPLRSERSLSAEPSADAKAASLSPKNDTELDGKAGSSLDSSSRSHINSDDLVSDFDTPANMNMRKQNSTPTTKRHSRSRGFSDSTSQLISPIKSINGSGTHDFKDRNPLDVGLAITGHLNGHNLQSDEPDLQRPISLENSGILSTRKTRKRMTSLTSSRPITSQEDTFSHHNSSQPSISQSQKRVSLSRSLSSPIKSEDRKFTLEKVSTDQAQKLQQPQGTKGISSQTNEMFLPQSLAFLSIDTVDLIAQISWNRVSPYTQEELPKVRKSAAHTQMASQQLFLFQPSSDTRPLWNSFIEQSMFYVLSTTKALLKTFEKGGSLVDTHTLWYCLMRLIRVNPSLVFDSLWIASADLYVPPQELWPIYDWTKKTNTCDADAAAGYTADESARLMSICLHVLIATVPYVQDSAQLFAASRARSYGLSAAHGQHVSGELVDLYMQIDDVFSDELALRLARRVFAAIPARRQYQEILRLNKPGNNESSPPPDILEVALASFNFLDVEVPPVLDFLSNDREAHEKRAPTLLIDWARTIMLQDWNGRADVPADGPFGGALAMISAIHDKRKSLLLGDVHFRTEYFADRLDSMEMPAQWLLFTPTKRTVHLLDHPYLFSPANLVTYFRAINFSRMSRSFEAANSMIIRIQSSVAPLMTDPNRREDLSERLKIASSKFLVLHIRRDNVLMDAFDHLWRREERELSRPLKIRLGEDSGEEGSDSGGVQQEFFRLAIAEALNPEYGTFTVDDRTRMTWFQPGSPEPLWKFELIGLIISLAVYNGLTLPVTFPKALYRKLLGAPVAELHHIEDGWPDLASGLTVLLEWDEKDGSISDVFSRTYEFTIDSFGRQVSRDMAAGTDWPQFHDPPSSNPLDARLVDSENRNEYVSDYILWLTDVSIRPQFEAFQKGFLTCLDRRSLSLFDPDILQSVVEGVQEIDISELRRYTRYVGWNAGHRTVKDFWSIIKKFTSDEKKKLLEFVTASDRVPVGGMRNLQFVIQKNGVGDIDGHLPTSYTCYGILLLPEYSSKDILREKLGMALENAKGFGFA